jgi:hypothetical protein
MSFDNFVPKEGYEHLTMDALKGMLVGVHWNVRDKTFSIVQMNSKHSPNKVIGYSDYVTLEQCYPHISKSEQLKVQNGGHKTRHAFVCGYIVDFEINALHNTLYYNPKHLDSFVDKLHYMNGQIEYLDTMEQVALAKVPSKDKPLVTYKNGTVKRLQVTG